MTTPFPTPWSEALRLKQWIKNLFLFLPALFGQKFLDLVVFRKVLAGFILFSLMTSAVYLFNDLYDLEEDRAHPVKKDRPLARGDIRPDQARKGLAGLAAGALILALFLDATFFKILLFYALASLLYTRVLKRMVLLDVFTLGGFFLLRIMAGTVLAQVDYSHWMLFMVFALALFLGFNKRRQDLDLYKGDATLTRSVLAQYNPYFIDQMISVLTSSMVIMYMLYTVDAATVERFSTTHLVWTTPFVYYGIFRYLYLVHKAKQPADPTRLLLQDVPMQVNLLIWGVLCVGIIYWKI